ncbi:MAG: flagellar hook capping FlgD N-terminal domain-containing protein [Paracoccaceae bacterium]
MTEITGAPGVATAPPRRAGEFAGADPVGASSNGADGTGRGERAVAEADFETFLSLLTTQMRNQDPLKPLESTEFVAQLASFSAVEQQIRSNERLDEILGALSGGPGAGLADWIGMEAETAAAARHEGGPLDLRVSPAPGADRAILEVFDADGRALGGAPVDPKAEEIAWDGRLAGTPVGPGAYRYEVAYFSGESRLSAEPARRDVRITDLRFGPEGPTLGLAGGGTLAPAEISALRRAAPDD